MDYLDNLNEDDIDDFLVDRFEEKQAKIICKYTKDAENKDAIIDFFRTSELPTYFNVQFADRKSGKLHHLEPTFVSDLSEDIKRMSLEIKEETFIEDDLVECKTENMLNVDDLVMNKLFDTVSIKGRSFDGTIGSFVDLQHEVESNSARGTLNTVLYSHGMMIEPGLSSYLDFLKFGEENSAYVYHRDKDSFLTGSIFIVFTDFFVEDGRVVGAEFYPWVKGNKVFDISSYYD